MDAPIHSLNTHAHTHTHTLSFFTHRHEKNLSQRVRDSESPRQELEMVPLPIRRLLQKMDQAQQSPMFHIPLVCAMICTVKLLFPCVFEFQRLGSTQTRGFESVVTIRTVGILPVVSTGCSEKNIVDYGCCMLQQKRLKIPSLQLKF